MWTLRGCPTTVAEYRARHSIPDSLHQRWEILVCVTSRAECTVYAFSTNYWGFRDWCRADLSAEKLNIQSPAQEPNFRRQLPAKIAANFDGFFFRRTFWALFFEGVTRSLRQVKFEVNHTKKFTPERVGKIFVTQFLCGTFSVPNQRFAEWPWPLHWVTFPVAFIH